MNKNKKLIFWSLGIGVVVLSIYLSIFSQAQAQTVPQSIIDFPQSIYCGSGFSTPVLTSACTAGFHTVIYCQNVIDNLCVLYSGSISCLPDCTSFGGTTLPKKYQYIGDSCKLSYYGQHDTLEVCQAVGAPPPPTDRTELSQLGARTFCKLSTEKQNSCPRYDDFFYCENNDDNICVATDLAGGPALNRLFCSNVDCSKVGRTGEFEKTRKYFSIVDGVCKAGVKGFYSTLVRCQKKLSQPPPTPLPPTPLPPTPVEEIPVGKARCISSTGTKTYLKVCPADYEIECRSGSAVVDSFLGDGYKTCKIAEETLDETGQTKERIIIQTITREVPLYQNNVASNANESCEVYRERLPEIVEGYSAFLKIAERVYQETTVTDAALKKETLVKMKNAAKNLRAFSRTKKFSCENIDDVKKLEKQVEIQIDDVRSALLILQQKGSGERTFFHGIVKDLEGIDRICFAKENTNKCTAEDIATRNNLRDQLDEYLSAQEGTVLSEEISELDVQVAALKKSIDTILKTDSKKLRKSTFEKKKIEKLKIKKKKIKKKLVKKSRTKKKSSKTNSPK